MEIDRGGPSYTVTTVEALRGGGAGVRAGPARRSIWSSGRICVADLGTWERSDDLKALVTLAVVSRPPDATTRDRAVACDRPARLALERVDGPLVDVSSSAVRDVLRAGRLRRRFGAGRGDALHSPPQSVRCRQMSALPAETTELSPRPVAVRPGAAGAAAAGRAAGRGGAGAPGPASLGGVCRGRSSVCSSPSPWEFWTCSIEPRVGRPRPSPAGGRHGSRGGRRQARAGHGRPGHDGALRCRRRLRHHQRAEHPPRADVGRRDRAQRQGIPPTGAGAGRRVCRTPPGSSWTTATSSSTSSSKRRGTTTTSSISGRVLPAWSGGAPSNTPARARRLEHAGWSTRLPAGELRRVDRPRDLRPARRRGR